MLLAAAWVPLVVARRRRGLELVGRDVRVVNWRGRTTATIPADRIGDVRLDARTGRLVLRGRDGAVLWAGSPTLLDIGAVEPFAGALGVPADVSATGRSRIPPIGPRDHRLGPAGWAAALLKLLALVAVCAAVGYAGMVLLVRLPGSYRNPQPSSPVAGLLPLVGVAAGMAAALAPIRFLASSLYRRQFGPALRGMPPGMAAAFVFLVPIGSYAGFAMGFWLA